MESWVDLSRFGGHREDVAPNVRRVIGGFPRLHVVVLVRPDAEPRVRKGGFDLIHDSARFRCGQVKLVGRVGCDAGRAGQEVNVDRALGRRCRRDGIGGRRGEGSSW